VSESINGTSQVTIGRRIASILGKGLSQHLAVNAILIAAWILAYNFADEIPLVMKSPSRYSILVVPFIVGAVVAATCSFAVYFSLPGIQRIVPALGMFLSGYTTQYLLQDFESPAKRTIEIYVGRLDSIGYLILLFSVLTMTCSALKFRETRSVPEMSRGDSLIKQPIYWALKLLVGDSPIILSTITVILIQHTCIDFAHGNSTNIYTSILTSAAGNIGHGLDSLALLDVQRQLAVANFWIGVSLGVTGVQLVMQQASSLSLELAFWVRNKLL
jgi:hypothetical protein